MMPKFFADEAADSPVMPLIPLRDVVVYPNMVLPLFVGRPKSMKALEQAVNAGRTVLLVSQKTDSREEPPPADLHEIGTLASIVQVMKLPDSSLKVLVEGKARVQLFDVQETEDTYSARAVLIADEGENDREIEAMRRALLSQFDQYVKLNKKMPPELAASIDAIEKAGRLCDTIAAHLPLKQAQKQELLELVRVRDRIERLLSFIASESDILQVEKRIRGRVKRQMEKTQRDYYLNEQVKAIKKELGDGEEPASDLAELEKKIQGAGMSKEALTQAQNEFKKLKMMPAMSAEATITRNYLDVLVALPWRKKTRVSKDLRAAEKVLDADHYGLEKVKERIVEYLAVQQRVDKVKAPILCLVGPPGVGKTSLGQSIARATNRKYTRMALGGVRDEAEIRGHRRTYIGALPGKILQSLTKAGVRNPLFLLDEVDKIGQDVRGDPASALLEVLDPEQNNTFQDHYAEVDFDLSDVMFVATANTLDIPPALLDRMEVIRLSGYTEDEKVAIATRYLLPKQMKANGLKKTELSVTEGAIEDIVRYYTREAGVRGLDREISKICRKVVKSLVMKKRSAKTIVNSRNLEKFLGVRRFTFGVAEKENQIGQVTGLAWTEVGGEILTIECVVMPGKGNIQRTGSLGDVMKESAEAARTVVRARAERLGIDVGEFDKTDMHIHVPEGATPKDGPSAGIAMATAMVSALTGIPVCCDVCMTGEITLRGEALPIGGLKEKLLAAVRGGLKRALIPEENVRDLAEIPDNIKNRIEIIPVRWFEDVLAHALERAPQPKAESQPTTSVESAAPILMPLPVDPATLGAAHP
ncbi:MAG: endopeptidase La [Zoogloeaceae bacterium]|nr:endopeptidase La [Zoogloeaceae bacterium]